MRNKLGNVFNDVAKTVRDGTDLLMGGLMGTGIYSAFSHAATTRQMTAAVIFTALMAASSVMHIRGNQLKREVQELLRDKPATRDERSPAPRPGPSGIIGGVG